MAQTIYTTCNPLAQDCTLWQNNGRTIAASDGVYSDGTTCYVVSSGIIISTDVCVTTTSTTTTTTTISGFYYNIDQHDCANSCAFVQSFIGYSPTSLTTNVYYNIGDGFVYRIISSTSGPSFGIDLTGANGSANCNIACSL